MKTLEKLKPNVRKSLGPDLKNLNGIKRTVIEVHDIKTKVRAVTESDVLAQLQSSPHKLKPSSINCAAEAKQRDEYLKLKNQNKYLKEQNLLLNQENKRFTLHDQRSKTISQLTGVLISKNQNEPLREKLISLDRQRINLSAKLAQEKTKNEALQLSIQSLRLQLNFMKEEVKRLEYSQQDWTRSQNCMNEHQNRIVVISNSIIHSFSQTLKEKLEELNSRINKVEIMQKIIKEQHSRLLNINESRLRTPASTFRSNQKDSFSTSRKDFKEESNHCECSIHPFSSISESYEKLEQENISLIEELKSKTFEIEQLVEQKKKILLSLQNNQEEKGKGRIPTQKFRETGALNIFKTVHLKLENKSSFQETEDLFAQNEKIYSQSEDSLKAYCLQFSKMAKMVDTLKLQLLSNEEEKLHFLKELNLKTREIELLSDELSKVKELNASFKQRKQQLPTVSILLFNEQASRQNRLKFNKNNEMIRQRMKNGSSGLTFSMDRVIKDIEQLNKYEGHFQ